MAYHLLVTLLFVIAYSKPIRVLEPTPNGIENLNKAIAYTKANPVNIPEIKSEHAIKFANGVTAVVFGRTSLADPGTHQRIIDVVGTISMTDGSFTSQVTLDSVAQGEVVEDGISSYDYAHNQVYFASDGAFGGTILFADMDSLTPLVPAAYYLSPVAFVGYDPVSNSRLFAGTNTPGKNFFITEQANFGPINYFPMPTSLAVSANDAYDGNSKNYYNIVCTALGKCNLNTWTVGMSNVTSWALPCIGSNAYITEPIFVNATDSNYLVALQGDTTQQYKIVSVDLNGKTCTVSPALTGLPPKPVIIVAIESGYKSGNIYISVTSNAYNAIVIYDPKFNVVASVHVRYVFEDIFVREV